MPGASSLDSTTPDFQAEAWIYSASNHRNDPEMSSAQFEGAALAWKAQQFVRMLNAIRPTIGSASLLVALPSFGVDMSQPVFTAIGATYGSLLRNELVDDAA